MSDTSEPQDVDPAAVKAGWNPKDGQPPYKHALEPADAVADGPGDGQ